MTDRIVRFLRGKATVDYLSFVTRRSAISFVASRRSKNVNGRARMVAAAAGEKRTVRESKLKENASFRNGTRELLSGDGSC